MKLDQVQEALLKRKIIDIHRKITEETADYVRECLRQLVSWGSPDITITITSGGGDVTAGLAIYDMIRLYPGKKTGKVVGYARSTAIIILQACETRQCARHADVLIHYVSSHISLDILRNNRKLSKRIASLEDDNKRFGAILAEKTKKSLHTIDKQCAKDKSMTAEEALEFGLIDKII